MIDEPSDGPGGRDPIDMDSLAGHEVHGSFTYFQILGRYRDLGIGLADASIVVLAERYGVLEVLTLDHRHFQALRGPGGRRFRLRPVG